MTTTSPVVTGASVDVSFVATVAGLEVMKRCSMDHHQNQAGYNCIGCDHLVVSQQD